MKLNEKFVITINRELGSGGRTVGCKLAERLGVNYYDKAVIDGLKDKFNLSTQKVEELKAQEKSLLSEVKKMFSTFVQNTLPIDMEPSSEDIFRTERAILERLANQGSCVVAGRSGFLVFREWDNHLDILIEAPLRQRVERVMRKQGLELEAAMEAIDKVDKDRETYIQKFYDTSRYDARNYDIVLSMEDIDEEDAVDIIMEYINRQNKKKDNK